MYSNEQIARMPISEVVNLPGGNGLVSPAFQMPLNFLGLVGWQHVDEGLEALVCEGQIVPRTSLTIDWLRALGRKRLFHRVWLRPSPLTDLNAKALTKDQLELTLVVSVSYRVIDPVYVTSLKDPLGQLTSLIAGAISEYIRSETFENIFLRDDGGMRTELKKRLELIPTLKDYYVVNEVLKAVLTGDERLIEVIRHRRIEQQMSELREEFVLREHARDMEMLQAKLAAEIQQSTLKAISDIASSGVDVRTVLPLLSRAVPALPPKPDGITAHGEDVAFTHFYPSIVDSQIEAPLHVYVHMTSAIDEVRADFVVRQTFSVPALTITETATAQFERGTTFTIIPTIKGGRVKPSRVDIKWEDTFEHVAFGIRVNADTPKGSGLHGDVRIYVGTLIVAQLPVMFVVGDGVQPQQLNVNTQTLWKYKKIFVSYSRKDEHVVRAIERLYAKHPAIETLIDYKFLRASDFWWPKIQEKIEEAEAFQLFWSVNAAESSNVSDEWKYALKLQRPIIPIILEPKPPIPAELAHIHFEEFRHFINEL